MSASWKVTKVTANCRPQDKKTTIKNRRARSAAENSVCKITVFVLFYGSLRPTYGDIFNYERNTEST